MFETKANLYEPTEDNSPLNEGYLRDNLSSYMSDTDTERLVVDIEEVKLTETTESLYGNSGKNLPFIIMKTILWI